MSVFKHLKHSYLKKKGILCVQRQTWILLSSYIQGSTDQPSDRLLPKMGK